MGKRSSSIGGYNSRISDMNNASSRTSTKKKSLLLQPGFSRNSRSNSVDTLNDGAHEQSTRQDSKTPYSVFSSAKKPMQRSKSQANLMTPSTPGNNVSYMPPNMGMGSAKSIRSKMSTDNRERMSSMGARVSKKDTRPLQDKNYIQEITEKVQKLALQYPDCRTLMSNGKIRPMTTQLFIMLSEIILQYFDPKLILNNANYATEIPNTAKAFLYRGKLDRTMLITVSTQHTYTNVIGFLAWFTECQEMAQAMNFELLFNKFNEENSVYNVDDDEDDIDFAIFIPFVAKCMISESKKEKCDHLIKEFRQQLNERSQFCSELSDEARQRRDELEELANTYDQFSSQVISKDRELEAMENAVALLSKDIQDQENYLSQTQEYINNVKSQNGLVTQELNKTESKIEEVSKEIQHLSLAVKNQELTLEDKEKLAHERSEILREINLLEAQTKSLNDIYYSEQIELSRQRNKVDSSILQYNRELYEHLSSLPNTQELTIGTNILDPDVAEQHKRIETLLESLVASLEVRPEEIESELAAVQLAAGKQDGVLKAMNDQLSRVSEKHAQSQTRMTELQATFELEMQALEAELMSVEREIEIVAVKKPNVIEVEKELARKKAELEELAQLKRKCVERMKQRILALDSAYSTKMLAREESLKKMNAKRNVLQNILFKE